LLDAPQAEPHAAGFSAGFSPAPHAAGFSAGFSPAPHAEPHAAGFSAGFLPAPHAVPHAALAIFSLFHPAMLNNAILVTSCKCDFYFGFRLLQDYNNTFLFKLQARTFLLHSNLFVTAHYLHGCTFLLAIDVKHILHYNIM
jgi:hypothetical protein